MAEEVWMLQTKKADFKQIGARFRIDPVTARIIRNRGIEGEAAIDRYLNGTLDDLKAMTKIGEAMKKAALCGLGQTAGAPIRDILNYFRAEVEAHIRLKVCPTGVCPMSGKRI